MDIFFTHWGWMASTGWSPIWEGYYFWGTETITFGWPLNTLSNPTKNRGIAQPPFFMTMSSTHFSLIDTVHFCRKSILNKWYHLWAALEVFFSGTAVGIHSRVQTLAERKCCATSSHKSNRLNNSATTTRKWDGKWVFDFSLWLQGRPHENKLLFFWILSKLPSP